MIHGTIKIRLNQAFKQSENIRNIQIINWFCRFLSISIVYDLLLKKIFVSVNVLIINYYIISLLTILVIIIKQYDYYFIGERISFQTKSYFLIGKYVNSLGCSWSDEWDNVETFYWLWGEYLLFSEICTFAPRLDIYI